VESLAAKAMCGVMERALIAEGVPPAVAKAMAEKACEPTVTAVAKKAGRAARKGRKKVSKYNAEFGRQLKRLKTKHSRTPVAQLMKRAHNATKRALK